MGKVRLELSHSEFSEVAEVYSRKVIADNFDDAHKDNAPMLLATFTEHDQDRGGMVINCHRLSSSDIALIILGLMNKSHDVRLLVLEGMLRARFGKRFKS